MQTRVQRRNAAILRQQNRQLERARELALLPPEQKRRITRRYGHSKVGLETIRKSAFFKVMPSSEHKGNLKVLFLSASDYAFLGYTLARSLKSVGIEAKAISGRLSPLRSSSEQGNICSKEKTLKLAQEAHTIVWMHSLYIALPAQVLKGKQCVVFHGGTRYRRSPARINQQLNSKMHLSLTQTGELLDKGAINERWLLPPVDTVGIKPHYSFKDKKRLIIGHFSSHLGRRSNKSYVKGSALIESVIKQLKQSKWKNHFIFRRSTQKKLIPWKDNIKRMAQCDIYIESLSQAEPKNRNRHDWSIQALEACSLGCITITNFLFEERYREVYGNHGLIVVNKRDLLVKTLINLFQKDRSELLRLKKIARLWVEDKHSFEAVGMKLKRILKL